MPRVLDEVVVVTCSGRSSSPVLSRLFGSGLIWLAPIFVVSLSGCMGYTLVRKSDLRKEPVRVVVDSSSVVALRQQLTALQAQCRTDSIKHANTPAGKVQEKDNIIKLRDAEIASLKEQLNKAQDELERIKRRLAIPPTK